MSYYPNAWVKIEFGKSMWIRLHRPRLTFQERTEIYRVQRKKSLGETVNGRGESVKIQNSVPLGLSDTRAEPSVSY